MPASPLVGETASLLAALSWAVALTFFKRPVEMLGPWTVNLAKSGMAAVALGLTLVAIGELELLARAPAASLATTALSGVVGLTLGDTALLAAVERIGVHRALLFQTLGPVAATALAVAFFDEALRADRTAGIAIVLVGVTLVVAPAKAGGGRGPGARPDLVGYVFGLIAAFGQGAGLVLAKDGMADLPITSASFVRLLASTVSLVLVMAWGPRLGSALGALRKWENLRRLAPPTLLGTYVAILLMMAGVAFASASVAAVLLSTSPVFSLFIDRITTGTPITARAFLGTLIAVAGVGLLAAAET